ncbi:SusD/RagB family nutrient-binding outer membrane lipoprotein [Mucilaginibacter mali]|uniref:SusD/RagB family nutrient-binding outer membrane lipoprotein n=1 Tax=Mucilaginibacter mali TaxID=2740462 RepID=A0A7D4UJB7_9SPHI|nr:SusD/RagB family nutrient-binding outer membrane lipoprotein [Mucilaginibacter mali]QKJ28862.1 SusD/RagB family nutrient-binding outer membrane lipoprotein [Mucilaginibacter mali]
MKKFQIILLLTACLVSVSSCKKYLDVNTNPNAPQTVTANLYLSPMEHWMATAPIYDQRFIGRYTQNFTSTSAGTTWDLQGYDPASDNGAELWRDVYWSLGDNLIDMMTKSEAEQRWDLLGVGYVMKAWGWLTLTDIHGEIIVKEAFDPLRTTFDYDSQEYVYGEVQRLLGLAITNLQRTDGAVDATFLGKTDLIYKGDRTKWLKFAYGLLGMTLNHYSNKSTYKPADVIAAIDKSFASNSDDALLQYTGTANDDRNFIGPTRNNFNTYRQTPMIVNLMNGGAFGGVVDPRMSRILSASPDGVYRGVTTGAGTGAFNANTLPNNIWGYASLPATGTPVRYIFDDKSKFPLMTYAQLQFIKAEAAFKAGDKATALTAYNNGISAHIDFVNTRNSENGQNVTQITAAEKSAFLSNPLIVPTAANLKISMIMCQKYIAQWAWAPCETWMDLRRYHYTDADPAGGQVFIGYVFPTTLYTDNAGKPAYRIRPRYNSDYVWNVPGLTAIGGLAPDYHTKQTWIVQP